MGKEPNKKASVQESAQEEKRPEIQSEGQLNDPSKADEFIEKLDLKDKEIKAVNDKHLRLLAEFDNYKKRTAREQLDFKKYAYEPAILEILPIVDNLERAQFHTRDAQDINKIYDGLELIIKQSKEILSKLEVTPIPAKGEVFNPAVHQAIAQVETDEMEENRVVEEIARGYFFKDRVLRPAMVSVSKKKRPADLTPGNP